MNPRIYTKATTFATIDSRNQVAIVSPRERLEAKQARTPDIVREADDFLLTLNQVRAKGRLTMNKPIGIQAAVGDEAVQSTGPSYTVPRNANLKAIGWSTLPEGTWTSTRVPLLPVVSGDMSECSSVVLNGLKPDEASRSVLPKVDSGHFAPRWNDRDLNVASVRQHIGALRADKLVVAAQFAGGDRRLPESVALEAALRDVLKAEGVPIVLDKAGARRDGWDQHFVAGAVITGDDDIFNFNTLRVPAPQAAV